MAVLKSKKTLGKLLLNHHKNTAGSQTTVMPTPKTVRIPMVQHIGKPCDPLVKIGDIVTVGQKIGEAKDRFSVPVHSSVSGEVTAIKERVGASGIMIKDVEIRTDGKQTVSETVRPPKINTREDFINALYESGLCGLGGAGFPTHKKLDYKNPVDTLIVNGAECEPYITSDHRAMLEDIDEILAGIKAVMQFCSIKKAYIGIEDNKPDAISIFERPCERMDNVSVVSVKSRYPQGAEKVLIYSVTGRVVPEGKLPADVNCVVLNVTTLAKLGLYLKTGMPLVSKRITVDGDLIKNPMNVEVPIGTSMGDVIDFCGGAKGEWTKALFGGPMTGISAPSLDEPVVKNNNAILLFSEDIAKKPHTTVCIRCGKCVYVCPVGLMPIEIEKAYDAQDTDALSAYHAVSCINCGCCSYICPAKRNLAQKITLSKDFLKASH